MATQQMENESGKLLDVMASHLLARKEIEFTACILDWYRNDFRCDLVPMPGDSDAIRLAVKASIIERLVEVLNAPPRAENQSVPAWCGQIKGINIPLKLQSARLLEDEELCMAFAKRNLQVVKNFMYFI